MRMRLDQLLVERKLFQSRAKAQAAILAGKVKLVGCERPTAGKQVAEDALVHLEPDPVPFVSRGGLKLAAALDAFGVNPAGRTALDLGASTGGFTDCLLKRGALRVWAVDVGRSQLDASLRSDPRVANLERTHARELAPDRLGPPPERPDLAVVDVSFISLAKVLAYIPPCLKPPFEILALVKPQFEVGPKKAPKGVVRKEEYRKEALENVRAAARRVSLIERGWMDCPVHGPKGNVEYFLYLTGP